MEHVRGGWETCTCEEDHVRLGRCRMGEGFGMWGLEQGWSIFGAGGMTLVEVGMGPENCICRAWWRMGPMLRGWCGGKETDE